MHFKDLVYAARALRKSPVFFITAVAMIAVGIGASTAIFSVTNAVLVRPLPYRDPDRLVVIGGDLRRRNLFDERESYENWADLKNASGNVFEDMAAVATFRGIVPKSDGTPEQVKTALVTTNIFRLLGAHIVAGRDFEDSDGQPAPPPDPANPNAAPARLPNISIISYEYWQRRFGGSSAIFNKPIQDGTPGSPVIVGVLAPGFRLEFRATSNVESDPDIWNALRVNYDNRNRNTYFLRGIARLKPGVTMDRVQEVANLVAADVRKNFPIYGTGQFYYHIEPMAQHLVAEVRPAILALMGAVVFLLLIACANVANLLLVRMSLRERELAVRAALGGSRARLIGQVLAEAFLVAGCGTVLGLALAYLGIRELVAISPENLPRLEKVAIDPVVLLFSIVAGLAAAAVFGIVPAIRASRPDLMTVLRGAGRNAGLAGGGLRNVVAVVEVALSFILLVGSGLMVRSFIELQKIDLGFDPNHLLTFQLLGPLGQKPEERAAKTRDIESRLRALPGVESVTAVGPMPLTGGFSTIRWGKEDALSDPSKFQAVDFQIVRPGYFDAMHAPLLAGRAFTEADNAPDRNYAIVDQFFANKAFPKQSPIGKRILVRLRTADPEWVEIIGVAAHQRVTAIAEFGREQIWFTDGYAGHGRANQWALRVAGDPWRIAPVVRNEMAKFDSRMLVNQLQPMSVWVEKAEAGTRFSLILIGAFAAAAALLASVGLYGVLATFVRQRTAEIGVRMAMGAAPVNIFGLVVGQGLRLSITGIGIGLIAASALTRLMGTMLVGVRPTDPLTFAAIILLFLAVSALACWIPALRASSLDPTVALRDE